MVGCLSGTRRSYGPRRTATGATWETRLTKEGLTNVAINRNVYLGLHQTPHSSLFPLGNATVVASDGYHLLLILGEPS